tara:strand:+ start:288 stop:470 length:183 start_codon:yes stop_codon:yes gene_type:complete
MSQAIFQIVDSLNNYHPIVWSLSVMAIVATAAISLHLLWEVTLKGIVKTLNRRNSHNNGS